MRGNLAYLLAAGGLLAPLTGPVAADLGGVLSVSGTIAWSNASCPDDGTDLRIEGSGVDATMWVFAVDIACTDFLVGVTPRLVVPFGGPWNPSGGCVELMPDPLLAGVRMCFTNATFAGPLAEYDVTLCEVRPVGCSLHTFAHVTGLVLRA